MGSTLLKGGTLVNEGKVFQADIRIIDQRISEISTQGLLAKLHETVIDAAGKYIIPGMIDDQVHFREPGLTHKAEIYTEAKAAVAGGITSFMEMPNTVPNTLTQELLADKYEIGKQKSLANYSFFMGASNTNLEEVLKTNAADVCGIKVFMGSSTGNMLVDQDEVLEELFKNCPMLIATHCEDEASIRNNIEKAKATYGEQVPIEQHPIIRSAEACYLSSSKAVALAKKHNTRLHILHISTARELDLFSNTLPLSEKRITAEACIHHLWFNDEDYKKKGTYIKWNPAVKTKNDQQHILKAVLDNRIDIIATDHAPHTIAEKEGSYFNAPSGGPLVQHALVALFEMHAEGKISIEDIVRKTSHAVADCFQIKDRGYLKEGYFADLVIVDTNRPWLVEKSNVLSKCGWSPFEGQRFKTSIEKTFVSGHLAYNNGLFDESKKGERLSFNR
ncbi:MAG: dihydroorotase [Bacteroidetes bacterium]|nr:MAG: dihydroorotase [Bacteroidota bacterium]MBL1143546.1 dihydroorotase [Bacteroidota bacterium]NOG56348.1 dihydroorotase [Bacteroidota bacterium]